MKINNELKDPVLVCTGHACIWSEKEQSPTNQTKKKSLRRPVSQGEEIAKSEGSGRVGRMIAQKNRDGESESE